MQAETCTLCVNKSCIVHLEREKLDKSQRLDVPLSILFNDSVPTSADMILNNVILLVSVAFTIVGQCEAKSRNIEIERHHNLLESNNHVKWVNVNPCNQTPCVLDASQSYNVTIKVVTKHSAIGVNLSMTYDADGRTAHWLRDVNMCRHLRQDASCPLRAHQTVFFSFPLTLPTKTMTSLPKLLYVKMAMRTESDKHIGHIFNFDTKYPLFDINVRFQCDMRD